MKKFASLLCHVLGCVWLLFLVRVPQAQVSASARSKTDPAEATALRSIFTQWRLSETPQWNMKGDPCSGSATNPTSFDSSNPAVECDCNYQNGTICHITRLKVYNKDNVEGPIPEELQKLKYLTYLNLSQNNLTGALPAFIGNLTSMKYFMIGGNNFRGPLPPKLGDMVSLEEWYMDSSGLSGEIPSSFSKLKNMRKFWASDNNFAGKIPDFIGTWTNLTILMLQGNSFQGPIPSNLVNLSKLIDLRIGDVSNGSSSLDFIKNMKVLETLIVRHSEISGTIPPDLGESTTLQFLDLSFNNLTGELLGSLFDLSSLQFLFLGSNNLSGSLPTSKSPSLRNIDLSYNKLSGGFPSWVKERTLQLNLVANNFVINGSESGLPSGLSCLQRGFPCNPNPPSNKAFGIKCGGQSIKANDGITYEVDDKNLYQPSYYVTESMKWGFSNVGVFVDARSRPYFWDHLNQSPNTLDSDLFQRGRLSPSSLRYYGLGLVNGNYSIKLQFVEPTFTDLEHGKGRGRRIFHIYIQGILVEKDFDIDKEAGHVSYTAVTKNYTAVVVDNFLEIHFFWAGKGTCCIPNPGCYGPAIAAISVSFKDSKLTNPLRKESRALEKRKNTGLIVGIIVGVAAFLFLFILGIFIWKEWRKRRRRDDGEVAELLEISLRGGTFSFAELRTATEDFNPANKLGEGGFGPVFKGKLSDGRVVAVKQLSVRSHHGKRQFVTEVATISVVHHRNLVKLYGCCFEGDKRLLVYEYLENKSLDQALFGKNKLILDWPTRFKICLGMARGLTYLHEESRLRIVHRDVKTSNILLDSDLNPKISDFGLAKLYDDKKTHISTRIAGTIGYLAPEYALKGHLTVKADVYGFGVVALEIVCGRPNSDPSLPPEKIYLLEWAWHLHENKRELEMVDPTLSSYSEEEILRVIRVSLLCTQTSPLLRPSMSHVVAMLAGDTRVSAVTSRPEYLTDWQFSDASMASGSSQVNVSSCESSVFGRAPFSSDSQPTLHVVDEGP